MISRAEKTESQHISEIMEPIIFQPNYITFNIDTIKNAISNHLYD